MRWDGLVYGWILGDMWIGIGLGVRLRWDISVGGLVHGGMTTMGGLFTC